MPASLPSKSGHNKRELTTGNTARAPSAIKAIGDTSHTNGHGMIFIKRPSPKIQDQEEGIGRYETNLKPITPTTKVCTKHLLVNSDNDD